MRSQRLRMFLDALAELNLSGKDQATEIVRYVGTMQDFYISKVQAIRLKSKQQVGQIAKHHH